MKKRVAVEDFLGIPLGSDRSFSFGKGQAGWTSRMPRRGLRRACAAVAAAAALCLGPLGLADAGIERDRTAPVELPGG
jgi:hypothetical protein